MNVQIYAMDTALRFAEQISTLAEHAVSDMTGVFTKALCQQTAKFQPAPQLMHGHHLSSSHLVGASCLKLQQAFIGHRAPLCSHLWHDIGGSHIQHIQDAALTARHWVFMHLAVDRLALHLLLSDVMSQPACTAITLVLTHHSCKH